MAPLLTSYNLNNSFDMVDLPDPLAPTIAVVVPGAPDLRGPVVHPHGQAHLAQVVEGVESAHARADDDGVVVLGRPALRRARHGVLPTSG